MFKPEPVSEGETTVVGRIENKIIDKLHDSQCMRTKVLALKCVFKISTKIAGHFSTKIDDYFSHIFTLIVFFSKFDQFG